MVASYAEIIPLVARRLPPGILSAEATSALHRMASCLPPVLQGGFEVRLAGERGVDLHQCIRARDREPETLLAWLDDSGPTGRGWKGLARLCDAWVHRPLDLSEVWLELDAGGGDGGSASPSVFVGLVEGGPARETAEEALRVLLGDGTLAGSLEGVARCFSACAGAERVSHVGAMLARSMPKVRVNVKVAPDGPDAAAGYLDAAGWPGPVTEAIDALKWITALVDRVTLCLDVGPDAAVLPRLGFECSVTGSGQDAARWRELLDTLVSRGLCGPGTRDALLAWPELLLPVGGAEPWPAALVKASLTAPATAFTAVDCRISHVKVGFEPGQPLTAKGYLWFEHTWLRGGASAVTPADNRS